MITITLNGQAHPLPAPCALLELLDLLGLAGKPVVVEHNGLALLPKELAQTNIQDGDTLEIISIVAGG